MEADNASFVTPGEKIATEEEFAAGHNTFVENGVIYSSVIGKVVKEGGSVAVSASGREIKIIDRDMLVMGIVTDDVRSVIFVKIDDINIGSKDFLALKDGKIIAERPRMQRYGGGGGRDGNRFQSAGRPEKTCGVGDAILARVLYNDKDSYTLSLGGRETGVIYARCTLCGSGMQRGSDNMLECKECGNKEHRKVSDLYDKPNEIKKLFA